MFCRKHILSFIVIILFIVMTIISGCSGGGSSERSDYRLSVVNFKDLESPDGDSKSVITYDQSGNLTQMTTYDNNNEPETKVLFQFTDGVLSKSTTRDYVTDNEIMQEDFKYNPAKQLTMYSYQRGEDVGSSIIDYDNNGRITELKSYDSLNGSGDLTERRTYEFDSNGKIKKINCINVDSDTGDEAEDGYFQLEYNSKGYLIKKSKYEQNGSLSYYSELTWENGKATFDFTKLYIF